MSRNKNTSIRWIDARFDGHCAGCGCETYEGEKIAWDVDERAAYCAECGKIEEEVQLAQERKKVSTELNDLEAKFED